MSQDPNTQNPYAGQEPVGSPAGFPNNGSAPAGQGYNNAAFPAAPAATMGSGPHGALAMPDAAKKAQMAMYAVAAVGLIQLVLSMMAKTTGASLVGSILGVALMAACAVFFGKGKNWARIVFTVLAALGLLFGLLALLGGLAIMGNAEIRDAALAESGMGSTLFVISLVLGVVSMAAYLAGLIFAWKKPVTEWINSLKAAPAGI